MPNPAGEGRSGFRATHRARWEGNGALKAGVIPPASLGTALPFPRIFPNLGLSAGAAASAPGGYIPTLDGLRAVSIALVIFSHVGFRIVPGIFGVTIFFFVSGYLITGQLLAELDRSRTINLPNFYVRRILRLYPALLVMIFLGGSLYVAFGGRITPGDLLAALFYGSNYYERYGGFASQYEHPFSVLWSLAVEEHYYLVFPLICLLFGRARVRFIGVLIGLIAAFTLWRFQASSACLHGGCANLAIEHGTDTRADSILYGALLAALLASSGRGWVGRLSRSMTVFAMGIVLLCAALVIRDPWFRDTIRFSIQGVGLLFCIGGLLLNPALEPLRKLLSLRPVLLIGRWSYSLYLWHWVVISIAWELAPGDMYRLIGQHLPIPPLDLLTTLLPLLVGLSVLLAAASYYGVERPMLRLRRRFGSHAGLVTTG